MPKLRIAFPVTSIKKNKAAWPFGGLKLFPQFPVANVFLVKHKLKT